jgi:hypothetical protein
VAYHNAEPYQKEKQGENKMVDWAIVSGMGDEHGCEDMQIHDPEGHCGGYSNGRQVCKAVHNNNPVCPYCKQHSRRTDGREIYPNRPDLFKKIFYICAPCDAYVGCHPNSARPMGRLADSVLRAAKSAAHREFDKIWRSGRMSRTNAYAWLARQLRIPAHQCHIGMFDEDMCARVIAACSDDFEVVK